ncbi:MAG: citryl-CoA lyase [Bacillota bacterium]
MSQTEKKYEWRTGVAEATSHGVMVRGYDILEDLVGKIDFAAMVYLLFKGDLPTPGQAKMINALFVCFADHGISPSTTVGRFLQAAGVPIQAAVAGGVMMFGDIHGGAGQEFCRNLQELVKKAKTENRSFDDVATEYVQTHKRIDGFGHPQHPEGDPRPPVLFRLAREYGVAGDHIEMTLALERALEKRVGRRIATNIDGGIGACVCDLGMDWRLARAFVCIPRTAGLFAHCYEEMVREAGWRQIKLDQVLYDGPPRRHLDPEQAKGLLSE